MSSDATPSVTSMRDARQARARRAQAATSGPPLTTFIASWQLALEAAAKSPKAVRGYTDSVRWLCRFLVEHDMPADVEGVDAPHIRAYLLHEEQRTSAVSAAHHFRNIRVFFGWLASEGECENPNPMDRVGTPKVTERAKACAGPASVSRAESRPGCRSARRPADSGHPAAAHRVRPISARHAHPDRK